MNKRVVILGLGALIVVLGAAAVFAAITVRAQQGLAVTDPRLLPPIVSLALATPANESGRSFTGIVGARIESNLGFRVAGKIVTRLVNAGERVKAGQPLMRIDDTDLRLARTAKRKAVVAARATVVQLDADEQRYAKLFKAGWVTRQRYDQAKTSADTARAQLAAAKAEARVAENAVTYAVLVADTDGTVIETLGEPGQVVTAGQTVVRLAQAGPREAVVALPETIRPAIGSVALSSLYDGDGHRANARLRQLSDAADPVTRTYEARYVLEGAAATSPLGATVTIWIASRAHDGEVQVPLAAILDDGRKTGVWEVDSSTSTVRFKAVKLLRTTSESAVISGPSAGDHVVSLGAQLLHAGERVRVQASSEGI